MTVVIGTAGHIDHGKTSLLRALTGIDADRLPEERRRGMTIDVGYAHLRLADGDELDFVDVPGHDRLVGNMLVGAGEIDAALLVVAADDGPRAQTLEHLELLDGLGIDLGVAAVTKVDAVDGGRVADVVARVGELLGRTTLAGSPVVPVSSVRGDGLEDILAALTALRDRVVAPAGRPGPAAAGHRPRLHGAWARPGRDRHAPWRLGVPWRCAPPGAGRADGAGPRGAGARRGGPGPRGRRARRAEPGRRR